LSDLKKIFLNEFHKKNYAKFVSFAGYSMPINYEDGIIKEHLHTRSSAGLFDISHMGQILIPFKEYNINKIYEMIPLDFKNLINNKSYYSFILNKNGGIIDDIILSKILLDNKDYILIVYNSSRKELVENLMSDRIKDILILNEYSLIAIQGPDSSKIMEKFDNQISNISFLETSIINYLNSDIIISRSGYTGEDGFELIISNKIINKFIEELMFFKEIKLCGLGCRDSLRLEAGLSLYGNELNENITPVEANLLWAISKNRIQKLDFNGCENIILQIKNKNYPIKIGIETLNKSILRSNMELFNQENENIGIITSGGYSPSLNKSIGIAYVKNYSNENFKKMFCNIRNKLEEIKVSQLPFIKHNYYRRKI